MKMMVAAACSMAPDSRRSESCGGVALADLAQVDPALGAAHADGELVAGHLQGEDAPPEARLLPLDAVTLLARAGGGHGAGGGHVHAEVQDEAGLPHARPGGHDHQVAGVEAGGLAVELLVARGDAGDAVAALGGGGDLLE